MPFSFLAIELSVFAFALVLARHAHRQGTRWLWTYLWAIVFGLVAELAMVQHGSYTYGKFLVMVGPGDGRVPLWVAIGWGEIVYAATWTAQRMRMPWALRPLAAGLLAVNVDLSLDPIAELQGFWNWKAAGEVSFFGVPFDNYLGWLLIVSIYALLARVGFRIFPPGRKYSDFWVSGLCAALAVGLLLLVQSFSGFFYRALGGQVGAFVLVFGATSAVCAGFLLRSRRSEPVSWSILAVPLYFHGLLLTILLFTKDFLRAPALLVMIPLALVIGFFAMAWVSLEPLLSRSR